jgi:hypothetical protein
MMKTIGAVLGSLGVPCHASWQGTAQRRAFFLGPAPASRGEVLARSREAAWLLAASEWPVEQSHYGSPCPLTL